MGPTSDPVPEEELLAEIRRLADSDGPPTAREMGAHGQHSVSTYQRRFGSWDEAVERAFEDETASNTPGPDKTPEDELLAEIRRLADGDDPPTTVAMNQEGAYSASTYQHRFGSWSTAVKKALGDDATKKGPEGKIPEEDLLAEIRRLADGNDPPTTVEMDNHGAYSVATYRRRFGSWTNAVWEAIDVNTLPHNRKIPEEDLLEEIRRLTVGGDPPTTVEMNDDGEYSATTYQNRFGSWQQALDVALDD